MNTSVADRESVLNYFRLVGTRASLASRRANPFFRGRDSELNELHANVDRAVDGVIDNRTATVCGAPGAGKSELLLRFMDTFSNFQGQHVIQVHARHIALSHAPALMQSLLSALPPTRNFSEVVRKFRKEFGDLTSLTVAGTGFAREQHMDEPEMSGQTAHVDWFNRYSDKLPRTLKECVFVLCIDEFQNLKNVPESLCEPLHDAGLVLKIVPVYFGLANVPTVLADAGVSRVLEQCQIALGSLPKDAAESLIRDFLVSMEVSYQSNVSRDTLASDIAEKCDGWPHHLTSWMYSACEVLPNCSFLLTPESIQEINNQCDLFRVNYYEGRLERCSYLDDPTRRRAFGAMFDNGNLAVRAEIEETMASLISRSTEDFDISKFMDEALRSGLLMRQHRGTYGVPIPSLVRYMLTS